MFAIATPDTPLRTPVRKKTRVTVCRRALVLGSTALVGGCLVVAAAPAAWVACEIDGVAVAPGVTAEPDTRQEIVCLGEGLSDPMVAVDPSSAVTGTTGTIGDGATATELTVSDETAITILDQNTVTINAGATVTSVNVDDDAYGVHANGGNNTVTTLNRKKVAFAGVAKTPNQKAVAEGVDNLGKDSAVFNAVAVLNEAGIQAAFNQLSGEVHASTLSGLVQDSGALRGA